MLELKNGLLAGKAFDNRASVAAVAVCLEQLQHTQHAVGCAGRGHRAGRGIACLGATTSAFALQPDVAIAIDVTFGTQHNADGVETFALGKGPTINIGPNMHPRMTQGCAPPPNAWNWKRGWNRCRAHSGTDGWVIQVARRASPPASWRFPSRSMHTPVETVAIKDIERTGRLLAEFIRGLDEEFYRSLIDR